MVKISVKKHTINKLTPTKQITYFANKISSEKKYIKKDK